MRPRTGLGYRISSASFLHVLLNRDRIRDLRPPKYSRNPDQAISSPDFATLPSLLFLIFSPLLWVWVWVNVEAVGFV